MRQFDIFARLDKARHTERPHALFTNLTRNVAMNITQEGKQAIDILLNRGNEFQQRLGKIGGYPFMR